MSEPLAPPTRALYGALLCAALAVVPLAPHLPPLFVALALAGIAWRGGQLRRGGRALPGFALGALALAGLTGVLWRYGSPVGRDAGVAMLLLMTGLKALECRQRRDAGVLIVLALFLQAAAFFFEQSIGFALYALLLVTLALAALMGLETDPVPPWGPRLRTAGRKLVVALPLMVLLFYLFPRLDSPLGVLRDPGRVASVGLADSMEPGAFERLVSSREIAFRARFHGAPPAPEQLYWRGPVFWDYDGRQWRTAYPAHGEEVLVRLGAPIDYTLVQPGQERPWVMALEQVDRAPAGAGLDPTRQLLLPAPAREARQYELRAWPEYRLGLSPDLRQQRRALQLPTDAAPRARQLARAWRGGKADPEAVVRRALRHFREQPFRYTLRPPPLVGDPVDAFLFDTRAGFCEYYSGAFVVLMRAAGIPARVVAGYQGGEPSPVADYFLVRQSDAHAWAEVWLAGKGWVRVDPTAAVAPERVEQGLGDSLADDAALPDFLRRAHRQGLQFRLRALWDAVDYQWTAWVLGFSQARQSDLLRVLGLDRFGALGLAFGLMAGAGALFAIYALAGLFRKRAAPPDPEVAARNRLLAALRRHGLEPLPGEGPSDFTERAARALPRHAAALRACNAAFVALRYGNETLRHHGHALNELIAALCRDLRRDR